MLHVQDFGRRYRGSGSWAVRHLDFAIPSGSVTALVGPNGAGKSTLLRGCVGFERPDEGSVVVAGFDLRTHRSSGLAQIAYVPQAPALYRAFTVADHFDLASVARRTFDRRLALRLIEAAGIEPHRRVRELSGGEQAQVSLAVAVATRAAMLLLDEPIANLDPLARRAFLGTLFAQARQDGATVLLSSHLVLDIEQVCDRILVITHGSLALDATIDDAIEQFQIVDANAAADGVVGSFAGARGEPLALVRGMSGGRPPTLEEVVLGHLASSRRV